jgi:hypothetical protein
MRSASRFRAAWIVTATGALLSGAVAGALADAPAALAMMRPPIVASTLPAPKDSIVPPNLDPIAIACGAPGSCVAVGFYVDSSGHDQGLIETWSGGAWKARRAPLPPDAASVPQVNLFGVACSGPGSCAAIGSYATSTTPFSSGLLLSLSGGVWKATAATAPGGLAAPANTFTGVGCNAPGSCAAVGNYNGTDGKKRGLIAFFHSKWKTITAPLPADHVDPTTGDNLLAELNGVSCSSALCIGVGDYETSSNQYLPLAETITPSSATANGTQGALPSDAAVGTGFQIASLGSISCSHAGPCAAHGQYFDQSSNAHALLEPLGGARWAPRSAPPAPTENSSPPILSAISCPSATACVATGLYTDTGNTAQALFEVLAGNKWAVKTAPTTLAMDAVACGSASFCAGAATANAAHYNQANSLDVLSAGKWYPETPSVPGVRGAIATLFAVACDASSSCLAVGTWGTSTGIVEHITGSVDTTPPTIKLTHPAARFALGSATVVSWSASDSGSGLARIQVRWKSAAWNSGFSAWTYPGPWQSLPPSSTSVTATGLVQGRDYCYSARAKDHAGNWSAWTSPLCAAVPLDDRAVSADTHWTRVSNKVYWNSTATVTTAHLARMRRTGANVDRIAVIATTCSTCGTVGVYVGTTLIGKINLRTPATHHRSIMTLPVFSYRTGTITLKVLTSGKSVQIDGLGIART